GDDELSFTPALTLMMEGRTTRQRIGWLADLPLVQSAARVVAERRATPTPTIDMRDPTTLDRLIGRWNHNRATAEAIGPRFGVPTVFVLQPIPTYGYDLAYHLFGKTEFGEFERSGHAYERMAPKRDALGVLWLADMQQQRHENLYVDFVHYDDHFSRDIAA